MTFSMDFAGVRPNGWAILDMYFIMNDRHAQRAVNSLSFNSENYENRTVPGQSGGRLQKAFPRFYDIASIYSSNNLVTNLRIMTGEENWEMAQSAY